ncbi:hypothetical protein [Stieleria maiorica]|nr:hypothetical protein [Stieleria maiorica]
MAAVKNVIEELMDGFGKLDDSLHGGEPANVDEISDVISEQFTRLQAVL